MHGGMNSQRLGDRAGIHCRTVEDAALVLDAVKGFESKDMFTAIPKVMIPKEPFASFVISKNDVDKKPLCWNADRRCSRIHGETIPRTI